MFWTYERVKEEASKFSSRSDFFKGCRKAYSAAVYNNWLEDFKWLKAPKYWTFIDIYEEARKYNTRTEFFNGSKGAYLSARKNGWLDKIPWLKKTHHTRVIYTFEKLTSIVNGCQSKREFYTKYPSAYQSAVSHCWLQQLYKMAGMKAHTK